MERSENEQQKTVAAPRDRRFQRGDTVNGEGSAVIGFYGENEGEKVLYYKELNGKKIVKEVSI